MGGLWTGMPFMGGAAMVFTMASLGLPMLGNFIAEFLILIGAFPVSALLTVLATLGLIFSACYSLRMMQKVFLGPAAVTAPLKDLNMREWMMMSALTIGIVALGLFPQPVMDMVKAVVRQLVE
jgi:NADH-quinone oxidoreductase subunit M